MLNLVRGFLIKYPTDSFGEESGILFFLKISLRSREQSKERITRIMHLNLTASGGKGDLFYASPLFVSFSRKTRRSGSAWMPKRI